MKKIAILLLSLCAMLSVYTSAAPAAASGVQYVYLNPGFVVNYGDTGRMKYLKTDVALKVSNPDAAAKVNQHKPYLRNNLIMLLSAQEDGNINTPEGREVLRKKALDEVRNLMIELDGDAHIDDLYFSNFVAQN